MGVSDEEIIDDYHKSNESFQYMKKDNTIRSNEDPSTSSSAAAAAATATAGTATIRTTTKGDGRSSSKGRLDRNIFSGTNPEAMKKTLRFLRHKYGSVSPGYLDDIGFDDHWRRRLVSVLTRTSSAAAGRDSVDTLPTSSSSPTPSSRL
jgi:hypothetical protein